MATKKCPNGHQYDSGIYGDNCPFCPESSHTRVNAGATASTQVAGGGDTWGLPVQAQAPLFRCVTTTAAGQVEAIPSYVCSATTVPIPKEAEKSSVCLLHTQPIPPAKYIKYMKAAI